MSALHLRHSRRMANGRAVAPVVHGLVAPWRLFVRGAVRLCQAPARRRARDGVLRLLTVAAAH